MGKRTIKLTAADFFCGAGGWSEGLRLAGIETVFALDNWRWARETHRLNHPNCAHPGLDCAKESSGDILKVKAEDVDSFVPDTDIIVGSPPCVTFSSSNRAGKADKSSGIELTLKFLQIVAIKKHKKRSRLKYWLMENVPNSRKYLQDSYTFKELGISQELLNELGINKKVRDVALHIKRNPELVFDAADYGAPQHRKRFITGEYPQPTQTEKTVTLGKVLSALEKDRVADPVFRGISLPADQVTDHGYDTIIHPFEWNQARVKKEQGRYYGRMSFPEDEDRPSRTVMATRSVISRESLILQGKRKGEYRAPTIREAACLMSFPITYQFEAPNETSKYRLVGNAVCPALAHAFGKRIQEESGGTGNRKLTLQAKKKLKHDLRKTPPKLRHPKDKNHNANFAEIVPDLKIRNFRVELDNGFPRRGRNLQWRASIHHATGKQSMKRAFPTEEQLLGLFSQLEAENRITSFREDIKQQFVGKLPSRTKFQQQYVRVDADDRYLRPLEALQIIKDSVDKHFPKEAFENRFLLNSKDWTKGEPYIIFNRKGAPKKIPLRICAAALGTLALVNEVEQK